MPDLSVLTLNIAAASLTKAQRQLQWLATRHEDVFALTEATAGEGSRHLADTFTAAGYTVVYPDHAPGQRGVMLISKLATAPDKMTGSLTYLPARAAGISISTTSGPVRILTAYVPSRDASPEKTERKQKWISEFTRALTDTSHAPALLVGDLNVLEPDHQPRYRTFAPFEYDFYQALTNQHDLVDAFRHLHPDRIEHSWVGRTGDGYRYDHAHCSPTLTTALTSCEYIHETRLERLSDHSGLTVRLNLTPTDPLLTSDPAEAASPPTLF
jgi:exodeoxyribonuclease III